MFVFVKLAVFYNKRNECAAGSPTLFIRFLREQKKPTQTYQSNVKTNRIFGISAQF